MVNASAYYNSVGQFLNAQTVIKDMLEGKPMTILDAEPRIIGDSDGEKLVLSFQEPMEYLLPLNRTNAKILISTWGDNTDNWKGKTILLNIVKVNYQGKLVDGMQVKPVG
jgi:hypothetical protein